MNLIKLWAPIIAIISTIATGLWTFIGKTHELESEGIAAVKQKLQDRDSVLSQLQEKLALFLTKKNEYASWAPAAVRGRYQDRIDALPKVATTAEEVMAKAGRVQKVVGGWFAKLDLSHYKLKHFETQASPEGLQSYLIEIEGKQEFELNDPVMTIEVCTKCKNGGSLEERTMVTPVFLALPADTFSSHKTLTEIWITDQVVDVPSFEAAVH